MKKVIAILLCVILTLSLSTAAFARVHVRSYTKKSGTRVTSHYRTNIDHSRLNNWSHKGNINPYTGRKGYTR